MDKLHHIDATSACVDLNEVLGFQVVDVPTLLGDQKYVEILLRGATTSLVVKTAHPQRAFYDLRTALDKLSEHSSRA